MATLAERAKAAGLESAAELTRITATSKETLTNWMKDKATLFEVVLRGASISISAYEKLKQWASYSDVSINEYIENYMPKHQERVLELNKKVTELEKHEPEQLWTFSAEDLKEQAKLIEKLTSENARLKAELQFAKKKDNSKLQVDSFNATEAAKIARDVIAAKEKNNQETVKKLNEALLKIKNLEDALEKSKILNAKLKKINF